MAEHAGQRCAHEGRQVMRPFSVTPSAESAPENGSQRQALAAQLADALDGALALNAANGRPEARAYPLR